ncbi:MAG: phosphoglycerate kinase [Patescibacteria group bacterium]
MKTLKDLDLKNKKVLIRVDFNVPLNDQKQVEDDTRIKAALPTINYLLEQNCQVILISHLGRPKRNPDPEFSLKPIAKKLSELINQEVDFITDYIDQGLNSDKKIILLENIRFFKQEKENDPEFSKKLAELGDVYVNDAFGTAHRAHASTEGLAKLLPHAAGLLLEKEIATLTQVLENPEKPIVAIIGGAKISTKIQLIKNLLPKVDYLLLGGALANTVLLAQDHKIGKSLVEKELAGTVKDLLANHLRIPVDLIVAKEIKEGAKTEIKAVGDVEDDDIILDIGPDTVNLYSDLLKEAKTIIWNGPMGMFEIESFSKGTFGMAEAVARSSAYSIIGGGETVQALGVINKLNDVSFVSTGGGAMMEFLEGKELPAIKALM